MRAVGKIDNVKGSIYNIGGGNENKVSLIELIKIIEKKFGKPVEYSFSNWRPGDQKIFYCDIQKVCQKLGWKSLIGVDKGIDKLYEWVRQII